MLALKWIELAILVMLVGAFVLIIVLAVLLPIFDLQSVVAG